MSIIMISSFGSDIMNNWNDIRSKFRYNLLGEMLTSGAKNDTSFETSMLCAVKSLTKGKKWIVEGGLIYD
jgi:hypothetical protein